MASFCYNIVTKRSFLVSLFVFLIALYYFCTQKETNYDTNKLL